MKNFKKIISITLCVIMLMGTFALSSSALFFDVSTNQLDQTKYGDNLYFIRAGTTAYLYGTGETYDILELESDAQTIAIFNLYTFNQYNVNSLVVADGVTEIGTMLFMGLIECDNIYLPQTLKTIKSFTFTSCYRGENLEIPSSVELIETDAFFSGDTIIENVELEEQDSWYWQSFSELYKAIPKITIYSTTCVIEENAIPAQSTICCYAGSTAHEYALANGNEVELLDENTHECNWTWNFENEFNCAEENTLIGTCQDCGEKVYLELSVSSHYDGDNDNCCDICGNSMPTFFELIIELIQNFFDYIKDIFSVLFW